MQARSGAGAEPVTEVCQLHRDRGGAVPWVDTVGWEDRCSDNLDTFQVGRVAAMSRPRPPIPLRSLPSPQKPHRGA